MSFGPLAVGTKAVCTWIHRGMHAFCRAHNRLSQSKASQGNTFHYTGKAEKNTTVRNSSELTPATDAIKTASLWGKMKTWSVQTISYVKICLGTICQRGRVSKGLKLWRHAGTPHQPPLLGALQGSHIAQGGSPSSRPPILLLLGVVSHTRVMSASLVGAVSHSQGTGLSHLLPCPHSHTWGRKLCKGMLLVNLWGWSPRCPSGETAMFFVSCEDGKGEKK